jgi:integrase
MTTPSTDTKPKAAPKKRRRGKGEGTIYKHESSGLWTAQVTIGENAAGKPIKRTVYGKKRDDVKTKLQLLQEKMRRGTLEKPSSITLEQSIAHWLENDIKGKISDGTYHKYESNARVHIYPEIGGTEVQKLTRPLLSEFISKKESQLAPATVKIIRSILNRVIDNAIEDEIIFKDPMRKIAVKKIPKRPIRVMTENEMSSLLSTARDWNRNPIVYSILFTEFGTGLRRSELLPLRWKDIDFENKTLSIKQTYVMIKGVPVLKDETKNETSKEPIAVPESVLKVIQEQHLKITDNKKKRAKKKTDQDKEEKKSIYVFPAKDGGPINPNSFRRTFKRLIKEAGLDESIRFHDMRHNYASQLVALNVHQTLIQAQMRHSDAKSTSIYSHTNMDGQHYAAQILDKQLKQIEENAKEK